MIDGLLPAIAGIFLLAGTLKGVLGFGLPIISMSLLPFVFPIEQAITMSAIVQPLTNLFQLYSAGRVREAFSITWPVIITLMLGVLLAYWLLGGMESDKLLLLVGVTILMFSIMELSGFGLTIPNNLRVPYGLGFGFIAGVFGALTALNGWAFILYLMGCQLDRQMFRSSIALLFIVSGLLISSSFWALGWLNAEVLGLGVIALTMSFVGMAIGNRIGERLSGAIFRKCVLIVLAVLGCGLIAQS